MRFIKFYKRFSKVLVAILAACFIVLCVNGSKFVAGAALDDASFTALCVSLAVSAITSCAWLMLESAYQQAISRLMYRNKTKRGNKA